MCVCVYVCMCVCMCVHIYICVCVCARARSCAHACVFVLLQQKMMNVVVNKVHSSLSSSACYVRLHHRHRSGSEKEWHASSTTLSSSLSLILLHSRTPMSCFKEPTPDSSFSFFVTKCLQEITKKKDGLIFAPSVTAQIHSDVFLIGLGTRGVITVK